MRVVRFRHSIYIDLGRFDLTVGLIAGLYVGFQIGKGQIGLDLGVVFIELNW